MLGGYRPRVSPPSEVGAQSVFADANRGYTLKEMTDHGDGYRRFLYQQNQSGLDVQERSTAFFESWLAEAPPGHRRNGLAWNGLKHRFADSN
jgi:hypothetical protein